MASPSERRNVAIILEDTEESVNTSSSNVCYCKQYKRTRTDSKDGHWIRDETDDEGSPSKKRARFCTGECCKQEFVESLRSAIRDTLKQKLAKNANKLKPPSIAKMNDAAHIKLLETVEILLFNTADSLGEYMDLSTLDQRLAKLLLALMMRKSSR